MLKLFANMDEDNTTTLRDRDQEDSKVTNRGWVVALVAATSHAMISKGLNNGILGPTLNFLSLNINSTIDQTSNMLVGRSIGEIAGAFAFNAYKSKVKGERVVMSIGISVFAIAIVDVMMPFATSLLELVVLQTVGGFAIGFSISGMTALLLEKWGESRSRPLIQLNHFMYGVGGFCAPLIAKPFLEMEYARKNLGGTTVCPRQEATVHSEAVTRNNLTSLIFMNDVTANPVIWAYIIISIYTTLVAIFLFIIAIGKVEEKVGERYELVSESRPEESLKKVWKFLASVLMFYLFTAAASLVYSAYIYSTVVCSGLQMHPSKASLLNSLYWLGLATGRGSAVFISKFFKPSTLIIADLIGTISITTAMTIWGEHSSTLMWIGAFTYGIFVTTIFPCGISWSSEVTNMSGKYVFPFIVGANIGALVWYRVAGTVFQINPFSPIYLITSLCVATAICFGFMIHFARSLRTQGGC